MSKASEATALQRKIFSRWINQKIMAKGKKLDDCVNDLKTGEHLITLVESLAEKEFPNWKKIKNRNRMESVDACNQALKFVEECGVIQKMKCSAENLVDGDERSVLGLIWAIMLKFMKLEEDEDGAAAVSFADALKMWIHNQVKNAPYSLEISSMTKSFHDGKVFSALIHKFRPKLIDWEATQAMDSSTTLANVFKAAERYFGLEQYLEIGDIAKLDDKSMVVYASEYYYGIAQARKIDLAAKRVKKLIAFTKENDRLKADYTARATKLRERLTKVEAVLADTTIENTMAGAVRRLGLFNDYRKQDKAFVFAETFTMDRLDQALSRRLQSHKRPAYTPPAGCDVPALMASIATVEKNEASQNVALHEELNRQIKLAKIFEQYGARHKTLVAWIAVQKAYLSEKLEILSVGAANFALNQLDAFFTAFKAVKATVPEMKAWAKELLDNTFEHGSTVTANEAEIAQGMATLDSLSAQKKIVHEDDLARETLKAKVRGLNDDHTTSHAKLEKFITTNKAVLSKKEDVKSIKDAELHLGLTKAVHNERQDLTVNIAPLQALGAEILSTEYKSDLSQWKFEYPDKVQARETFVVSGFTELEALGKEKIEVLEDDLARENYREKVRQWNENHKLQNGKLQVWIGQSKAYVEKKEPCDSVENAQDNLVVHRAYMVNEAAMKDNDVAALLKQGKEILDAKYESKRSSWVFPAPGEVKEREAVVLKDFEYLASASAAKLEILEDDLAREEFRFKVNKWNEQHIRQHSALETWIGASKEYVDKKEEVNSVEQAQDNLIVIHNYLGSQKLKEDGDITSLQNLGKQILQAKYATKHSQWAFPTPSDITTREAFVTNSLAYLQKTSAAKLAVLEDDLGREEFKFRLGLWNDQHADMHSKLGAWVNVQMAYLAVEEPYDSILDAEKNLKLLAAYNADKADVTKINVKAHSKLGGEILAAEYKTSLSHWKWENSAEVQGRLDTVKSQWATLDANAAKKKAYLDAALAKEIRKEELRVSWAKHSGEFMALSRDQSVAAPATMFGFVLEEVEAFEAKLAAMDADITKQAAGLKAQYDPVWAEMLQLGVRTPENPYSKLTPDDTSKAQSELAAALAARKQRFDAELAKQRADDAACRALAAAVDPFVKSVGANKAKVAESKEDLEPLLAIIVSVAKDPDVGALNGINAAQAAVDERKIIYNRHTLNNAADAQVQFTQYTEYISTKKTMVEGEIQHRKLRGLTQEQYDEMKTQFDQFDKDKSGFLDKKEFRSCLYSMGEERGKKEIDAILTKLGNGDANKVRISYDGYKEFMIEQLGDTDTEEEILKGFRLMNRQEEKCQWEIMGDLMEAPALEFIRGTHQDDYTAWTASVFAR